MTMEFTGFERPRRLASTARLSSMDILGNFLFDPRPRRHAHPMAMGLGAAWSAAAVREWIGGIGRRQELAIWMNLKRVLESQLDETDGR